MSFPKYEAYKDSGVEWLGEVPEHWKVLPIKRDLEFLTSGSRGWAEYYSDDGSLFIRIGNLTRHGVQLDLSDIQRVAVPEGSEGERTRVRSGDVLFSITAYLGSVAVVPDSLEKAYVSQHVALARLFCKKLLPYWVAYITLSQLGKDYLASQGYGGTKIQLALDDVANLVATAPSLDEQRHIISFLDHETVRIDALIAEQQRLIELLKEKRQAVISHAVTKGLDPTAPLKDSGVEWIGEVPTHWRLAPLKYECSFLGGGTPSKENLEYWNGDIPWVSPKDMKTFWISDTADKITKAAVTESSTNMVSSGALLLVVRSGILQRTIPVAINRVPVTLNQDMKALCFHEFNMAEFISYFIKGLEASILLEWRKQGATVESIEFEYLANTIILVPPIIEIDAILNRLRLIDAQYDVLQNESLVSITFLQERRSALISAAVTGKIDVRGWQAPASAAPASTLVPLRGIKN
jgi:type I restriction enzyme S subunit